MIEFLRLARIFIRIRKLLIFKIIKDKALRFISLLYRRQIIRKSSSYNFEIIEIKEIPFSYLKFPDYDIFKHYKDDIEVLVGKILEHKFDIFCSGDIKLQHGVKTNGFMDFYYTSDKKFDNWENFINSSINEKNRNQALKISNYISQNYIPIDWQLDIKSGYRWSESNWYIDVRYGNLKGADIKVPWEIGRFQHIIYLSYLTYIYKQENKEYQHLIDEFQNQIYDFIASNPPEFGCQWKSSMEVGIRAVNWLITYDLFVSCGVKFDNKFIEIFSKSIYRHAKFIVDNLEWSSGLRNNHYFCNIVSLLIISSYLPVNDDVNNILCFAFDEFFREIDSQYYNDGGNFENSLSYHFLSTEMLLWGIIIIDSLSDEKLNSIKQASKFKNIRKEKKSSSFLYSILPLEKNKIIVNVNLIKKLINIFQFTFIISRSDYSYAQIGDNDSGRFIVLTPFINRSLGNKNLAPLLNIMQILTAKELSKFYFLEYYFISLVLLKNGISSNLAEYAKDYFIPIDNQIISFSDSGIFLFKNSYYQVEIVCGNLGQWGKGGHNHNDQLSITLSFKDKSIIVDPGTFVYTPSIEMRNKFRSVNYHNTLSLDSMEPNPFIKDKQSHLFWIAKNLSKPKVINIGKDLFIAEHYGYGEAHRRIINFGSNFIMGKDICKLNFKKRVNFHLSPEIVINEINDNEVFLHFDDVLIKFAFKYSEITIEDYQYSHAYGCLKESKRICLTTMQEIIEWEFRLEE